MNNTDINKTVLKKIAIALAELNAEVIYVGGATVGLYANTPAAEDVRPTKDLDISLSIATIGELEKIREELIRKGFIQTSEDDVICRFRYEDIKVDVMNTKEISWAPANPWFKPGFDKKEEILIEGIKIQILPLAYFLASKFTAYENRGKNEPRTSHDFEDITYVLDNRTDLVEQICTAPDDVRNFLKNEFHKILNDDVKKEAIHGNLSFSESDKRFKKIIQKLSEICN